MTLVRTGLRTLQARLAAGEIRAVDLVRGCRERIAELDPDLHAFLRLNPAATRTYEMRTFGTSDTLMVLFEDVDGELRYRTGDDDSGEDRNAYIRRRLYKRRKYVLRIRMYYADRPGETGVMWW